MPNKTKSDKELMKLLEKASEQREELRLMHYALKKPSTEANFSTPFHKSNTSLHSPNGFSI